MITPETFEMVETISLEALERHPVWASFEAAIDRGLLLAWGIPEEILNREFARYEFCGHQPLYPVLQLDPLPQQPHLIVQMTFETASGRSLQGYLLAPYAFGIFVNGREFCFNRNLSTLSGRVATELERALGTAQQPIFPLQYASELRTDAGDPISGEISRFW